MDIVKESIEEEEMIGIKVGSTTESETTKNSKSKKRCESSMTEVNPKNVKYQYHQVPFVVLGRGAYSIC